MAVELDHITILYGRVGVSRHDPKVDGDEFMRLVRDLVSKAVDEARADAKPVEQITLNVETPAAPAASLPEPAPSSEDAGVATGAAGPEKLPSKRRPLSAEEIAAIARRVADHRAEREAAGFQFLRKGFVKDLALELNLNVNRIADIDLAARRAAGLPINSAIGERARRQIAAAETSDMTDPPESQESAPPAEPDSGEGDDEPFDPQPDPPTPPAPNRDMPTMDVVDAEIYKRIARARQDAATLGQKIVARGTVDAIARELAVSQSKVIEIATTVPSIAEYARERQARKLKAQAAAQRLHEPKDPTDHPSLAPARRRITPTQLKRREVKGGHGGDEGRF